jgi:hypothetical protein
MKRLYCLFLCLILNICYSSTALASDYTYSSTTTEILDDGSYIETTIKTNTSINLFSSTFTKNGQKTSTYKDSSGKIYWSITVNGNFSYNGSSSKCTSSTISTTCPSKLWKLSSKSSGKSGATATASVVAKRYTNGSITKTIVNGR